jgi:2-polyprenyl-3-methyl-5-hydroxy-6-metoxy-1,4-benzoquinol methylase
MQKGELMEKNRIIKSYVAGKRLELILQGLRKLGKRKPKNKLKILDVDYGDGYFTRSIRELGYSIIGIGRHAPKTAKWMKHAPDKVIDAMITAFPDNSFDAVIALEVVENVPCFPEINRVLKPGGYFFCSTPAPGTDWIRRIIVSLKVLEAQDFEYHDHLVNLHEIPMTLLSYRRMFFGISQFAIFTKNDKLKSPNKKKEIR